MTVKKYRKKPVVIEALQYQEGNVAEVVKWMSANYGSYFFTHSFEQGSFAIETLEGNMTVVPNDYIIKGMQGEFFPCKPDIFALTYEPVDA